MLYGLVGAHLPHSYSKIIHESLGKYAYELLELDSDSFKQFISGRQYGGLNITIPYKKAVLNLCDQVSDLADEIGAANTLYFQDGKLCCTNTDYDGFLYALHTCGIKLQNKKVLILGSGGTSLTAQKAALNTGAAQITVASRQPSQHQVSYDKLPRDAEIIINTTPVGTYPNNDQKLLALKDFPKCAGVVDVIYNPLKTDLLRQAEELGLPTSNGIPMLVAQATAAAEFFTGEKFQNKNQTLVKTLIRTIENIVLIGMPGCGKSTLGGILAEKLNKTFVDLDTEVEKIAGKTIPEIFSENGEDYFRRLETEVAMRFGKERSQVIATGGGTVLRPENMTALQQNGRTIFLQRDIESLPTQGRPLSKDLKSMYETRLPLYNRYSDLNFQVTEDTTKNANALIGGLY